MTQTISHQNYMAITFAVTSVATYIMTITSVTININKLVYHVSTTKMVKTIMFGKHMQTHIVQDNIPHTASKVCVLGSITCSHT